MSRHLERQALAGNPATVVVGCFQRREYFTPATARRFTALASSAAMVAVFGAGMADVPTTGVRGHNLAEDDELLQEWTIAVVGPHFAGALVARDVGDDSPEADRRFDYVLTYDRQTVVDAAAVMMRRLGAVKPGTPGAVEMPGQPSRLELLSRAVSAAVGGIVIADVRAPDLPLIYANAGFERMTGYSVEEILGRNCRFLQGPDTDAAAVRALGDLVRAHATGSVTLLNYRKDGSTWWNEVTLSPMRDASGVVTHMIGVQQDVTARVQAEAEVIRLGSTDPLTGLANRCTGLRDVERLLKDGQQVALVFCDLDGFKQVNDRHGHVVGDQLLAAIGRRLGECLTDGERVFRFGGDEFVVFLQGADPDRLAGLVHRLERAVAGAAVGYGVGVSTGIAVSGTGARGATALIAAADEEMYRAKRIRQVLSACGVG
jgi:diguanylate cyclase (GGDEF)-like protein/PAS domain S-box-containing protein